MGDSKKWNDIAFADWNRGKISVSTNEYIDDLILLKMEGDCRHAHNLIQWITPAAARELASKLVEAADAADAAGSHVSATADSKPLAAGKAAPGTPPHPVGSSGRR